MELTEISKLKLEFIDLKVKEFIDSLKIETWPIDCVSLIFTIQNEKKVKVHVQSTLSLPNNVDARTICIGPSYYIFVNKNRIRYPYKKSSDRRLNFTIAHEFGHIYLNHFDLPDDAKPMWLINLENREADEFAARLLMPEVLLRNSRYMPIEELARNFNVSLSAISTRLLKLEMS